MNNKFGKLVAAAILIIGLASLAIGGFFVQLGFDKANYLTEKMAEQKIAYAGAGSDINGIIDTPQEAQAMANILQEHSAAMGNYSELARTDPNRQQILNALTMINSLQLAIVGYGLTDVVKACGAFMVLSGLGFVLISIPALRRKTPVLS